MMFAQPIGPAAAALWATRKRPREEEESAGEAAPPLLEELHSAFADEAFMALGEKGDVGAASGTTAAADQPLLLSEVIALLLD